CAKRTEPLPCSSGIRKHFGGWGKALEAAGLERTGYEIAPQGSNSHRAAILDSLAKAKERAGCLLSQSAYRDFLSDLPASERGAFPTVDEVQAVFGTWANAVREAKVDQGDKVHPDSPWSSEEARRIARTVEEFGGAPLSRAIYDELAAGAGLVLPPWPILCDLIGKTLSEGGAADGQVPRQVDAEAIAAALRPEPGPEPGEAPPASVSSAPRSRRPRPTEIVDC